MRFVDCVLTYSAYDERASEHEVSCLALIRGAEQSSSLSWSAELSEQLPELRCQLQAIELHSTGSRQSTAQAGNAELLLPLGPAHRRRQ